MSVTSELKLDKLPLRAVLSLATRCAYRVRPIVALTEEIKQLDAVESAIVFAERFAKGRRVNVDEIGGVISGIEKWYPTSSTRPSNPRHNAGYARDAASHAARAALNAANAVESSFFRADCYGVAMVDARIAIDYSEQASDPFYDIDPVPGFKSISYVNDIQYQQWILESRFAKDVIMNDYRNLLNLVGDWQAEPGPPINPLETGPLGPYWPEERIPEWYLEGLLKAKELRVRSDVIEVSIEDEFIRFDESDAERFIYINLDRFEQSFGEEGGFERVLKLITRAQGDGSGYGSKIVPPIVVHGSPVTPNYSTGNENQSLQRLERVNRLVKAGAVFYEKGSPDESYIELIGMIEDASGDDRLSPDDETEDEEDADKALTREGDNSIKLLVEAGFTRTEYVNYDPIRHEEEEEDTGDQREGSKKDVFLYGKPPYPVSRQDFDQLLKRMRTPDEDWRKDD